MNKKILIWIMVLLSTIIIASAGYLGLTKYVQYTNIQKVAEINALLSTKESRENCKKILDFDTKSIKRNTEFNISKFKNYRFQCDKKYNIRNINLSLKNCKKIIKGSALDYKKQYILLDAFTELQQSCSDKYFKISFSTGSFFDVNNDFKSSIHLDFSFPFYEDTATVGSEEYMKNRIEAKQRLISLLDISPEVNLSVDNIVLYPKKGIIKLVLQPLTKYKMSLKSFNNENLEMKTKKQILVFTTPENRFLGIRIKNPVSLYMDTYAPEFEIIKYNLPNKKKTKLKICRISNENYAKIEILRGRKEAKEIQKEFFLKWIDALDTFDCKEKVIDFDSNILFRKKIDFSKEIGKPARSGLYFVTFSDYQDRNINNSLQFPLFFGIIDSHITMKVSKNGEGYFFVNDFDGNPVADQEIRVYLNKFVAHTHKYNKNTKKQDYTYNSPLNNSVLWKEIFLWKTGEDGVLQVDLKNKLEGAFEKTFSADWSYKYTWINESFFVTSASDTHLTYNHSHWNAGIAPWNFWYKINSGWYGNEATDQNTPVLSSWWREIKEFYSHIYTDRVLYLPWEEVNIKSVIRKSTDLSIPKNKEFRLIVKNSKDTEILNSKLELSEFWSISEKLKLSKQAPLWNYSIILKDKNGEYARWYFSVEVFKNPKFKNEVSLETVGLNGEIVKIDETKKDTKYYWRDINAWKFSIQARVDSKYYNGAVLKNANFSYKVYKQYYWDDNYWDDCYWGCFWEPKKTFYTEWKGKLDENGKSNFTIDVAFESAYEDYKYIVEVTVTDINGDTISWSNSIIARLPDHLKSWNSNARLKFTSANNYYKQGEKVIISWWLSQWKWTSDYDNTHLFIIKKKDYTTKYIDDVRGYKRPVNVVEEKLEKVIFVNSTNFRITKTWKLELDFIPKETGEYVFEYGKINKTFLSLPDKKDKRKELILFINEFNKKKKLELQIGTRKYYWGESDYNTLNYLAKTCNDTKEKCSRKAIRSLLFCKKRVAETKVEDNCTDKNVVEIQQKILLDDLLEDEKQYLSILAYGKQDANNPIKSDNKVRVLSQKVNYHLGDTAQVLIRLPFSKWKILWTVEKQGVVHKEYIDVTSNMFFKEIKVDDTFIPNAYIWVVAIETPASQPSPLQEEGVEKNNIIPEYKVWYTEIVVDKTDKKSYLEIKTNKETYKPREKVVLNIKNTLKNKTWKKAELTVMVVDDSLISLMWNVDINTLEKFYKKLPFQVQTSLTNVAMLKNYYFSRPWIVGWSGFWNFKWGDSAVSSRTIFKNTAYYNPNVITDDNGNAQVEFELPDNLTTFRVMVVSNSQDNFFGLWTQNIKVRKNIVIEDKTPFIYRSWDKIEIWAQIFNHTDKEIGFKVQFKADNISVHKPEKRVSVQAHWSKLVSFWTEWALDSDKEIKYKIVALGDSKENSDIIERVIENKEFPILTSVIMKGGLAKLKKKQDFKIDIPENTDLEKSKVKISFSNNLLQGIWKTVNSLLVYPYWCIEQMTSSTYPNAIILKFATQFPWLINKKKARENLRSWLNAISDMQTVSGWFWYWPWDQIPNLHITPYVLRRLIDMKEFGAEIPDWMIEKAASYLEKNFWNITENIDRAETFYALAKLWKWEKAYNSLLKGVDKMKFSRHEWIAYTYWLIIWDKEWNKDVIERNIQRIKEKLEAQDNAYRYWSKRSDKALFTALLLDYGYSKTTVLQYIKELYGIDWSNYYHSTTAKNNAFIAFAKYTNKYGKDSSSKFAFSIGTIHNRENRFHLWEEQPSTITREFSLEDIVQYKEKYIELTTYVLWGADIFTNLTLEIYPKDTLKIEPASNEMNIERKIYEVLDPNKIEDCSVFSYWKKQDTHCWEVLREVTDGVYKKGTLYKVGVQLGFDTDRQRRNIALEDYIPSSFRIINSKFKTESIAIKKGNQKSWTWNHVEYLKDRVFASSDYVSSNRNLYFEYMITPDFRGEFMYPPVSGYMMYDWDIRAHGKYEKIIVK